MRNTVPAKKPCRGCPDGKVSISLREFRRLSSLTGANVTLRQENERLRNEIVHREAWREKGHDHGYELVHNPEVCEACHEAQNEEHARAEEREREVAALDFAPEVPVTEALREAIGEFMATEVRILTGAEQFREPIR